MKLLVSGLASNFRPLINNVLNVRAVGVAIYQNMDDTNVITLNIDMTVRQAKLASLTVTSVEHDPLHGRTRAPKRFRDPKVDRIRGGVRTMGLARKCTTLRIAQQTDF
ncbi:hypothetical protein EVAR_83405_1 [Eumeta japonica]|uniref:Uncharacterized protein n=1 Tax=Eumeta variegata TaxID=151549 RepID=A0A4C1TYF4_EUMVA|nr:hypothetical protein EVAR_83405_1 [Eumeta japonica]